VAGQDLGLERSYLARYRLLFIMFSPADTLPYTHLSQTSIRIRWNSEPPWLAQLERRQ
jgi:hypothetical protein